MRNREPAPFCARRTCKNRSYNPSGWCHVHEGSRAAKAARAALDLPGAVPPPPFTTAVPEWVSGAGVPHPTGEYDEYFESRTMTFFRRAGVPHRIDGPAVVYYDGSSSYLVEGKFHREDGPAVIDVVNEVEKFYLGGVEVSAEIHAEVIDLIHRGAPVEWALAYAEGSQD